MKITHTALVPHAPETVANAAAAWLRAEANGHEPEILRQENGTETVYLQMVVDWVMISTEFHITPLESGSHVLFLLEMTGTTFLSRMRNLSMIIARRVVQRQTAQSFQAFIAALPPL